MRKINSLQKKLIIVAIVVGSLTGYLIDTFLSGNIIVIPKGTHEGGIISAIGVGVILIIMSTLILIGFKIVKRKYNHLI